MATRAGVGMSHHHSPLIAGHEAAEQALEQAGVSEPDFVFMFATVGYDQRSLLHAVREATGGASLTGCSGEGTISGDEADESHFSVVVMAISSDELRWSNGLATGLSANSRAVGKQVAHTLSSDVSADAVGLFVFPDGLTANVDHFLAGLEGSLRSDQFLPIWGGCPIGDFSLVQCYQYCDDEVVSDGVAYALLSGEAQPAWALGLCYVPIGSERTVTRSQGNVIYEIDGKPALEVLQEYQSDPALAENWGRYILTFALCFRSPSYMKDEEYTFRTIPSVNKADGSITVQTEVQEGTSVWFSVRDKEKATVGLDRMAQQIKQQLGDAQPKLVFQFDCTARGKTMFREQEKLEHRSSSENRRRSTTDNSPKVAKIGARNGFRRPEFAQKRLLDRRSRQSHAVAPIGWSGGAMGGFLHRRGDRSGRGAQLLSQLHGGCSRPKLTIEALRELSGSPKEHTEQWPIPKVRAASALGIPLRTTSTTLRLKSNE